MPKSKTPKSKQVTARPKGLSAQDEAFVDEYMVDFNARNAALRCGFPRLNAKRAATMYLERPEVMAEVSRRLDALDHTKMVSNQRIVAELMAVAFGTDRFNKMTALAELGRITGVRGDDGKGGKGKGKKHKGGVMLIPGMPSLLDWEKAATEQQRLLKEQVRE